MGLKTMQSGKKRRKIARQPKIKGKIRLIGKNFLVAVVLEIFVQVYLYDIAYLGSC